VRVRVRVRVGVGVRVCVCVCLCVCVSVCVCVCIMWAEPLWVSRSADSLYRLLSKETYTSGKRDLHKCQKRPTLVAKETYTSDSPYRPYSLMHSLYTFYVYLLCIPSMYIGGPSPCGCRAVPTMLSCPEGVRCLCIHTHTYS